MIGDGVVINKGASASILAYGIPQSGNQAYATKGSTTINGVWHQKPNPAYHNLPSGYTEMTHIESSGTQYINTGVSITSDIAFDIAWMPVGSGNCLNGAYYWSAGTNTIALCFGIYSYEKLYSGVGAITDSSSISISRLTKYRTTYNSGIMQTSNANTGSVIKTLSSTFVAYPSTANFTLFGATNMSKAEYCGSERIYSSKIIKSGSVVRNLIPCVNPSNVVGMYDLVSQTFFGNSGTGSFTAGDVVPQYITGFFISPINEFGTWTVHAIESGSEKTQNVLIDAAEMFGVDMSEVSA